jgi:hypothetical protein
MSGKTKKQSLFLFFLPTWILIGGHIDTHKGSLGVWFKLETIPTAVPVGNGRGGII